MNPKKFFAVMLFCFMPGILFAANIVIELKTNVFYAGERIGMTVKVLDADGNVDDSCYGDVTLSCPDLLFQVRGKNPDGSTVDMSLPDDVSVSAGISTNLYVFSWGSGTYKISAVLKDDPDVKGFCHYTSIACKERLLISEVMFKATYSNLSYIELFNASSTALDLSKLEIRQNKTYLSPSVSLLGKVTFPYLLSPDQYLVVALNKDELGKIFQDMNSNGCLVLDGLLQKPDTSCNLLVYLDDQVEDTLEYASDWAETRHSLERCSLDKLSPWRDYWQSCFAPPTVVMEHHGTPGKVNGNNIPLQVDESRKTEFTVSRNVIRNVEEEVECVFLPAGPGRAAAELCDVSGKRIRFLLPEQDVSDVANHRFAFHGQDNDGNRLPAGLYFVVLRLLYVDLGVTEKVVRKVVVGW